MVKHPALGCIVFSSKFCSLGALILKHVHRVALSVEAPTEDITLLILHAMFGPSDLCRGVLCTNEWPILCSRHYANLHFPYQRYMHIGAHGIRLRWKLRAPCNQD